VGGKTSTSTSQVQIPPEVLARYNSVNQTAQQVAQTPFQQYSTNPNAFVEPLTPTQQAGVANTNSAAGMAQPYFQAGTGFALAGSQPVNANPLDTSTYMNPYLNTVLGSTEAMVNQQNQQAQSGQTGTAMSQGYFGGDRSGIASAVLQGQQELAGGQLYSGIASDAYQQALAAAQQQQGVNLGAAQANRQAVQQTGETLAGLGTGAQGAAIQGAQAQLGAGQVEQQTGQAGKTALYNQFLQQQSYPFQTAQFLANIAEGTGALSGSTTATTQPGGLFSDERLKEDIEPIGKGFDGANIIRFRYKGDPTTRIGMSAQEVEHRHPEAVSEGHGGFKVVDYGRATDDAAGFARAANDDFPEDEPRQARQAGGMSGWGMYPGGTNPMVIQQLLESQAQMYAPYSGEGGPGLYGGSASGMPHGGSSYVPKATLPVGQLQVARPPPAPQQNSLGSDIHSVASFADDAEGLSKDYHFAREGFDKVRDFLTGGGGGDGGGQVLGPPNANGGRVARQGGGGLGDFWTAVSGSPGSPGVVAANRRLAAHTQAVRAAQAQQRAAAAAAARQPPAPAHTQQPAATDSYLGALRASSAPGTPAPGIGVGGGDWGILGPAAHWLGQQNQSLTPAQQAAATDSYLRTLRASSAPAGSGAPPPAPAPNPSGAQVGAQTGAMLAARHAALAQHHQAAANQHRQAAAAIDPSQLPTLGTTAGGSPNLPTDPLPSPDRTPVPLFSGSPSDLQTGFAPANLQPYNPNVFQRFGHWAGDELRGAGDWIGGELRNAGHWLGDPAPRAPTAPNAPVIQSEAFQHAPVIQSEAFQPRAPVTPGEDFQPAPALHLRDDSAGADDTVPFAAGGFARAHRDMGGDLSDPMNDNPYKPQGPGLNIPTAPTQQPKLATATPPGQGGPSGLSQALGAGADLASIGSAAAKFLPMLLALRRGGRAGYADGGPPAPDPAPDPDADPTPQPVTHDPDAAGYALADATSSGPPPPAGGPPSGGGKHGGFSLANLIGGAGHALGEMVGAPQGPGEQWNVNRTMPFLTGIADMLAAPTKYPLVALTQGLKGGAQSYMATQQQEAQMEQERANAELTRFQAQPFAQQAGFMQMPGPAMGPDGMSIDWSRTREIEPGRYIHLGHPGEATPGGGGATAAPGLATQRSQQGSVSGASAPALPGRGPIQVDYAHGGNQTWAPSDASDAQIQSNHLDASGGDDAVWNNRRAVALNPGLQADQATGDKAITDNGPLRAAALNNSTNLRMLGQAINSIPPGGIAAMGASYEGRQDLVRMAQTVRRMLGLGEDRGLNADLTPGDIIAKINTLASTTMAHATGQHSADIANALKSILPGGGSSNPAAANHIIASLMTQNQRDLDFGNFANAYTGKYGTSVGVQEAFDKEMTPIYGQDQGTLERMLVRQPGQKLSMAEYLQAHPDRLKDFEQGTGGAPGLGMGIGRYFRGGV
jgi:hypothetical protein